MSAAPATAALPTSPAPQAGPAGAARAADGAPPHPHGEAPTQFHGEAPAHSRAARLHSLLRTLIVYGQDLARTVQQRAAAGTLLTIALDFGTRDAALILARIARGLRLAAALEARLLSRPLRPDAVPAPGTASGTASVRAPAARARRTARRGVRRPRLPEMPTAEEIAAALRRRPAAAVLTDICRDLGIGPLHPLWRAVAAVIAEQGGTITTLYRTSMVRAFTLAITATAEEEDAWLGPRARPAAAYGSAARGTGPP